MAAMILSQSVSNWRIKNMQGVIPYNHGNEEEIIGFDGISRLQYVLVHSYFYRYDSYNTKYKTLKYTRNKEYSTCH